MQYNQMCVPDEASVQVDKNCSALPDCPAALGTLPQRESEQQFQETEQTMNNLHSKGYRSSRIPMTIAKRRESNRKRERQRQARLKGAFNVLRSVIPDHFSEREPGDRLSRIQTLRLAKNYIATLHELLETC